MGRIRPAISEQMLVVSCFECGRTFGADELPIERTPRRVIYRCPTDGAELVRVGVGVMGKGGGDLEYDRAESVRVKLDAEEIDLSEFMRRDDSS